MRGAVLALLLCLLPAVATGATKVVTVSELEDLLTEAHAQHRSDAEMAQQIGSLELSQRLTEVTLARFEALLEPNSQSTTALELLADQAIFYQPSEEELTDMSTPDSATRQKIFKATADYINQFLANLPNLLATRTVTSYSGGGYPGKKGAWIAHPGWNKIGTTSLEISVRNDGVDLRTLNAKHKQRAEGMNSWGEFGGMLQVILSDSVHGGQVLWDHWEPSLAGQRAVFAFVVPQPSSHYAFDDYHQVFHPGYHGLLWVDPANGTVTRAFLELDADSSLSFMHFGMMVQYSPVKIEEKTCICPVRSVSVQKPGSFFFGEDQGMWLNEITFTNYHRFGSTVQIIAAPTAASGEQKPK